LRPACCEVEVGVRGSAIRIALTASAIAGIAALGLYAVLHFAAGERDRELRAWQARLGVVADSRADAVSAWVDGQYAALADIADNLSVQLYMTELAATPTGQRTSEALAQAGYLENLLRAVAARAGFTGPVAGPDVDANVRRAGVAGIALLDSAGRVIAATPGMPPLEGRLAAFLADQPAGRRALLDLSLDELGQPAMGFALPVFAVQGDRTPDRLVGRVVGVREVAASLYPHLRQPGQPWASAEAILVRPRDSAVEYISPLLDGSAPLARALARDTPNLEAAWALDHPGGFGALRDYKDAAVLAAARPVAGTPWSLVYKIDRVEALGESEARLQRLIVALLLAVALVTAALVAAWRHGASRRAERAAAALAALAQRHESQRRLLQLVTDSQPNDIAIVDRDGRYRFANLRAAQHAGISSGDMLGKTVAAVFGPAASARTERLNREALELGRTVNDVERHGVNGSLRVVQSSHVPVPASDGLPPGVLVVEQDITEAVTERERRERTQRQLVGMLVRLVDRRDPFAGDHSARVAAVARAVAEEMGLDPVTVDTAETAGKLMNLGKILVPSEVLTKPAGLTVDEIRRVRESLQTVAAFLADVEFDGPVVATLRQLQERWDGTGAPTGLAGDEILLPARIVAVANAFVAMVSDRAFRAGIGLDAAAERLLAESGHGFDRRVVAALVNRLDNRGGRQEWAGFRETRAGA